MSVKSFEDLHKDKDGLYAVCFRNNKDLDERHIQIIFTKFGDVASIKHHNSFVFVRFDKEESARAAMNDKGVANITGDVVKAARKSARDQLEEGKDNSSVKTKERPLREELSAGEEDDDWVEKKPTGNLTRVSNDRPLIPRNITSKAEMAQYSPHSPEVKTFQPQETENNTKQDLQRQPQHANFQQRQKPMMQQSKNQPLKGKPKNNSGQRPYNPDVQHRDYQENNQQRGQGNYNRQGGKNFQEPPSQDRQQSTRVYNNVDNEFCDNQQKSAASHKQNSLRQNYNNSDQEMVNRHPKFAPGQYEPRGPHERDQDMYGNRIEPNQRFPERSQGIPGNRVEPNQKFPERNQGVPGNRVEPNQRFPERSQGLTGNYNAGNQSILEKGQSVLRNHVELNQRFPERSQGMPGNYNGVNKRILEKGQGVLGNYVEPCQRYPEKEHDRPGNYVEPIQKFPERSQGMRGNFVEPNQRFPERNQEMTENYFETNPRSVDRGQCVRRSNTETMTHEGERIINRDDLLVPLGHPNGPQSVVRADPQRSMQYYPRNNGNLDEMFDRQVSVQENREQMYRADRAEHIPQELNVKTRATVIDEVIISNYASSITIDDLFTVFEGDGVVDITTHITSTGRPYCRVKVNNVDRSISLLELNGKKLLKSKYGIVVGRAKQFIEIGLDHFFCDQMDIPSVARSPPLRK